MNVWIEMKGNVTRLRLRYEGKRYCLSLGKVPDSKVLKAVYDKVVVNTKNAIELDLLLGKFDKTLSKYRLSKPGINPSKITAVGLFEEYAAFIIDKKKLSPGSIGRYNAILSKLRKCLKDKPAHQVTEDIAKSAIVLMGERLGKQTVQTYLFIIRACWNWAAQGKYNLADSNPWDDSLDLSKNQSLEPEKVKFFTITELKTIIGAFGSHPKYCFYSDFLLFLAQTGCRFGEAASLRWKHLGVNYSTAFICSSISRGYQNPKGTKTGKSRTVQLSPTLQSMLRDRYKRTSPQQNDLLFPSQKKGGSLNDHYFSQKVWKKVLDSSNIDYKSPYCVRHTAISHALDRGVSPIALAEQTGHSVKVLLEIYAHAVRNECLFDDFGG